MKRDIIIDRLVRRSANYPQEPAYYYRREQEWQRVTWQDFHQSARSFAAALIASGLKHDDKVAILGSNSLEWVVASYGAQYIGCVCVGVYTSSSKEEVAYVVDHSDAKVLVVENLKRFREQVEPIKSAFKKLEHIVLMSDERAEIDGVITMRDFLQRGENVSHDRITKRFEEVREEDTGTLIYTSGTTGAPKAVMLSHAAIAWTIKISVEMWRIGSWDKNVSYLPLAHIAEQMFTLYAPIECGMRCYFAESFESLKNDLSSVEPTVFFGVPRVYEKIYDAVKAGLKEKSPTVQKVVGYFSGVTKTYHEARFKDTTAGVFTEMQYRFARDKLFSKIRKNMGLGKARICVSGAAPISKQILEFFAGLDIPVYEVYGQSENSGPATCNLEGETTFGSVGRAIAGVEIKIADDGEVLIKGPNVFKGYYKNQAATDEVLKNGWLYTGDIGRLDAGGYLHITDRKKDILITAGGKNISPQNLEAMLKGLPYVQSAVVVGDGRKYLCALLSPDKEKIAKKAAELGLGHESISTLVASDAIMKEITGELAKVNEKLASVEQIKKITLLPNEFSVDGGEFTPTMKVKRKFVNQKYGETIEAFYRI